MEHPVRIFEINGLYGERNVRIEFDTNTKIIVAENGYGKTTVLNAFYSILAGDLDRLRKIPFESISLTFDCGQVAFLEKNHSHSIYQKYRNPEYIVI